MDNSQDELDDDFDDDRPIQPPLTDEQRREVITLFWRSVGSCTPRAYGQSWAKQAAAWLMHLASKIIDAGYGHRILWGRLNCIGEAQALGWDALDRAARILTCGDPRMSFLDYVLEEASNKYDPSEILFIYQRPIPAAFFGSDPPCEDLMDRSTDSRTPIEGRSQRKLPADDPHDSSDARRHTKEEDFTPIELAKAHVAKDPSLSIRAVAKKVGISKSALDRSEDYKQFAAHSKQIAASTVKIRKGSKSKDGTVDATYIPDEIDLDGKMSVPQNQKGQGDGTKPR